MLNLFPIVNQQNVIYFTISEQSVVKHLFGLQMSSTNQTMSTHLDEIRQFPLFIFIDHFEKICRKKKFTIRFVFIVSWTQCHFHKVS